MKRIRTKDEIAKEYSNFLCFWFKKLLVKKRIAHEFYQYYEKSRGYKDMREFYATAFNYFRQNLYRAGSIEPLPIYRILQKSFGSLPSNIYDLFMDEFQKDELIELGRYYYYLYNIAPDKDDRHKKITYIKNWMKANILQRIECLICNNKDCGKRYRRNYKRKV